MPRTTQRTPSYRLHKPSGRAVVRLDGRDYYLGPYDSEISRREYDRVVGEWLSRRSEARTILPRTSAFSSDLLINELMLAFIDSAAEYYQKNGKRTGEYDLLRLSLRPVRRLYGQSLVGDFGPRALKTVREAMIEDGLCRAEINRRVSRVLRMFKWGVEQELVDPMIHHALAQVQPLKRGRTKAREPDPIKPVEDERINAIKPHVSRQVWAMVELQRLSAMRPGEICLMRGCDVDRSGEVWIYTPAEHKTEHHGHDRKIPLGPKAQKIIEPWLRENEKEYLFSPKEAVQERQKAKRAARKTRMQPSQLDRRKKKPKRIPSERYTRQSYYQAIRRACEKAEIDPWHPNQLRHTAATRIRRKYGLEAASTLLGHRGLAVTQVYAERDESRAIAVAREDG